jgi:hypothetical protein
VGAGGFRAVFHDEALRSLYRGTSLALFGVSNGALQFVGYEKMEGWVFERKRQRVAKLGRAWTDGEKLVRVCVLPEHTLTHLDIHSQYGVYGHVWRVEAGRVMHDVLVPSDSLAHTGACTPFFARVDC